MVLARRRGHVSEKGVTMRDQLVDLIVENGPIPFEEFQERALYGAGGFFVGDALRSVKAGDFLTSPEVSPLFGATLAAFVTAEAGRLGAMPRVVEVGAGSGSLLKALLEIVDAEAWAVEVSMAAQIATSYVVGAERVVASLDDVPFDGPVVVIANELLDNFPVAIAVRTDSGWEERWIGVDDGDLCLVAAPLRDEVADWVERYGGDVPVGGLVEAHVLGDAWFRDLLGRIETGTVCIIDYGDTAEALVPRRSFGTLRTYRSHHRGPDPLAFPGETDITADVNFSSLLAICGELGWEATLQRQEDFLTEYGLRAELSELRRQELALARDGDPMERLVVRSRKNEAETLLHSRGLGDFRVLVARH